MRMNNEDFDPVYTWAKWNRSKIGTKGLYVYTRTIGTVPFGTAPFGTAIRTLLGPLKERFYLEQFGSTWNRSIFSIVSRAFKEGVWYFS